MFGKLTTIFSQGRNLLMFPEGTRTTPGKPITIKRGAAQIAIRTDTSIRVIHIDCSPVTLTKNTKWYNIANSTPTIKIVVGEKINPKIFVEDAEGLPSLAARRLTSSLQQHLSQKIK